MPRLKLPDSFSLVNDPRNPYGKLYTVDKLGNVWGARHVICTFRDSLGDRVATDMASCTDVNTTSQKLKEAVVTVSRNTFLFRWLGSLNAPARRFVRVSRPATLSSSAAMSANLPTTLLGSWTPHSTSMR